MSTPSTKEALLTLNREEVTVLYLTCMGVNYEKIGEKLSYSEHWVQYHMSNVYVKLGFNLDWHWTKRRELLKGEYCPALNKMIKSRADLEKWPPDPNPPVPNDRALVLVIEDQKREEEEKGEIVLVEPEEIGIDDRQGNDGEENGGCDRPMWIIAGLALISFVACVIAAIAIYGYISRTPTPQTVVVVATQVDSQPAAPVIQPTSLPAPTDVPIPTFTTIASQSEQVPPPGSPLPAGDSFSKNGIVVSTSPDIRYAPASELFNFYVYITNHRSSDYIVRAQRKYLHLTDDTGIEYEKRVGGGESFESVVAATVKPGDTVDWHFGQTTTKFFGPINPNASRIILTIDELAGMKNLVWYWDLD